MIFEQHDTFVHIRFCQFHKALCGVILWFKLTSNAQKKKQICHVISQSIKMIKERVPSFVCQRQAASFFFLARFFVCIKKNCCRYILLIKWNCPIERTSEMSHIHGILREIFFFLLFLELDENWRKRLSHLSTYVVIRWGHFASIQFAFNHFILFIYLYIFLLSFSHIDAFKWLCKLSTTHSKHLNTFRKNNNLMNNILVDLIQSKITNLNIDFVQINEKKTLFFFLPSPSRC